MHIYIYTYTGLCIRDHIHPYTSINKHMHTHTYTHDDYILTNLLKHILYEAMRVGHSYLSASAEQHGEHCTNVNVLFSKFPLERWRRKYIVIV